MPTSGWTSGCQFRQLLNDADSATARVPSPTFVPARTGNAASARGAMMASPRRAHALREVCGCTRLRRVPDRLALGPAEMLEQQRVVHVQPARRGDPGDAVRARPRRQPARFQRIGYALRLLSEQDSGQPWRCWILRYGITHADSADASQRGRHCAAALGHHPQVRATTGRVAARRR